MKQLLVISFFIVAAAFTSCGSDDKEDTIGGFEDYKVNKTVMTIPAGGGTDSIQILNAIPWWIQDITTVVDGEEKVFSVEKSHFDGGWFKVESSVNDSWYIKAAVDNTMKDKSYEITIHINVRGMTPGPQLDLIVKKKE